MSLLILEDSTIKLSSQKSAELVRMVLSSSTLTIIVGWGGSRAPSNSQDYSYTYLRIIIQLGLHGRPYTGFQTLLIRVSFLVNIVVCSCTTRDIYQCCGCVIISQLLSGGRLLVTIETRLLYDLASIQAFSIIALALAIITSILENSAYYYYQSLLLDIFNFRGYSYPYFS